MYDIPALDIDALITGSTPDFFDPFNPKNNPTIDILRELANEQNKPKGLLGRALDYAEQGNPATSPQGYQNVEPNLASRVFAMTQDSEGMLPGVRSGFRSPVEQAALYRRYLAGQGAPANPPGQSRHETGDAIDINMRGAGGRDAGADWITQNARYYGLTQPHKREPWHVETDPTWQGPMLPVPSGSDAGAMVARGPAPSRSSPFEAEFQTASRESGVPVQILKAMARQESNFNPNARGGAGEIGLIQIMPSTARDPGYGVRPIDPEALRDPATNLRWGAQYLAAKARHMGVTDWNDPQQVAKGLLAYNGGGDPNYVSNVTRYLGDPFAGLKNTATQALSYAPTSQRKAMDENSIPGAIEPRQNPIMALFGNLAGDQGGKDSSNGPTGVSYGGLGGLGGRKSEGTDFRDFLSAVGLAMMSSPRHSPFATLPTIMAAMNKDTTERRKIEAEQQAMVDALKMSGMTEDQARRLSVSPAAAKVAMEQFQRNRTRDADQSATRMLLGGGEAAPAPAQAGAQAAGMPPVQATDTASAPAAAVAAPAQAAPQNLLTDPSFDGVNRTDRAKLQQYQRVMLDPNVSDHVRKAAEAEYKRVVDNSNMTATQKEYLFARQQGFGGTLIDYKERMAKAGATKIEVNPGEKGYDATIGKSYADRFIELQKDAQAARGQSDTLSIMRRQMETPGFRSGAGAELEMAARRGLTALGVSDPNVVASMENFNKFANKAIMDGLGGSLGSGVSNADRDFIKNSVPNLMNTPEGNRQIIDMMSKLNERKSQVAALARDYAKRNGGRLDAGFDAELEKWANENPLFPKKPEEKAGAVDADGWFRVKPNIRIRLQGAR